MENAAILIIDFINDIVHPDGRIATSAGFIHQNGTIKNANHAISLSRRHGILPIFVKVGFSPTYLECPEWSPLFGKIKELNALQLNTWGTAFHESLAIESNDLIIVKHRVNAFYATALEAILRANQINTLLICGVATNMTVSSTARDAHDRDYRVIIIEDACAAATEQLHHHTVDSLSRLAMVIKANAIPEAFQF